ncbi:hypothetical protein TWF481_001648 [Arthrobotrys musiformis]|uniref:Serine protease n=1 Tax=Arthrobotrys musiformis TaxID=47236 RepID=A0AAV9VU10_9PEZI
MAPAVDIDHISSGALPDTASPEQERFGTQLEAEQVKRLRGYIVGGESTTKRPAVIKFKVSWKLCSRVPADGLVSERFEAEYSNGIAFAITPTILLTARHIFRSPTARDVLKHYPKMKKISREIEAGIKFDEWVISSIKWCTDDSDAGYELCKTIVLGSDFVALRSLKKEHHHLALAADEPGQHCWSIQMNEDTEPQFRAGTWNWRVTGVKGVTTCFVGDRYSGSPLVNVKGHAIGIVTHTTGGSEDPVLGHFSGSPFLLKYVHECLPEVGELKPGVIEEELLSDIFLYWAVTGSLKDYTRALSLDDPDSDKSDPAPKRQRKHTEIRKIESTIRRPKKSG